MPAPEILFTVKAMLANKPMPLPPKRPALVGVLGDAGSASKAEDDITDCR